MRSRMLARVVGPAAVAVFLLAAACPCFAANKVITLFADDFEGSWPGAWDVYEMKGNGVWCSSTSRSVSATHSAYCDDTPVAGQYTNGMETWLDYGDSQGWDLSKAIAAEIRFKVWVDVASAADYVGYYWSHDWNNYNLFFADDADTSGWEDRTIDLAAHCGEPQLWLMFDFVSNPNGTAEGVYIDDFELEITVLDDGYEENDTYSVGHDLSADESTWLTNISGSGLQWDEDWYRISVDPGCERLVVELTFTHADGNIDIEVYESDGSTKVVGAYSSTDDENIDYTLPSSGTYYLRVYGADAGTTYDMRWNDVAIDDNYEDNDTSGAAYDISGNEGAWLSTINGTGIQFDEDWYEILVDAGYENLIVDLTFTHASGNVDLQVYESDGTTLVTESVTSTDDESVDAILSGPGTYYVRVYGADSGNTYDLRWNDMHPDDNYEENDTYDAPAYDLSLDENAWLSAIDGLGIQWDNDWYEVLVDAGYENLVAELTFTHASGNIDLRIYESDGTTLVVESATSTDNESIDTVVPSAGSYYVRVYGANAGNTYDLLWHTEAPPATAPDLAITSVVPSDLSPEPGEVITVEVTVENLGDAAAGAFGVELFYNPAEPPVAGQTGDKTDSVGSLNAGASFVLTFTGVTCAAADEWTMYAYVDPADDVPESDELNNVAGPRHVYWGGYEGRFYLGEGCGAGAAGLFALAVLLALRRRR